MGRNKGRQERWVLSRVDLAWFIQESIPFVLGQGGPERVVDAGIPPKVDGTTEARDPDHDQEREQDQWDGDLVPPSAGSRIRFGQKKVHYGRWIPAWAAPAEAPA